MSFRRKPDVYCKFYHPGNPKSCRNGEECAFIHDDQGTARRYSQSNSHEESFQKNYYGQGTKVYLSHHGARTVKIDPKYKYIADRAKNVTPKTAEQPTNTTNISKNPTPCRQLDTVKPDAPMKKEISPNDPSFFSSLHDLSKEDLEQFEVENFTLGSIPLVPPPFSLA